MKKYRHQVCPIVGFTFGQPTGSQRKHVTAQVAWKMMASFMYCWVWQSSFAVNCELELTFAMKLYKSVHTYNYPWSLVSAANWQKYPNEHCPHVYAVDVLDRRVDPETGILVTERLITVKQNVPTIILKVSLTYFMFLQIGKYTDTHIFE